MPLISFLLILFSCPFHPLVSDPRYGGTYMTLLNTIANLGGNWPSTLALWFVEDLDWTPPAWLCTPAAATEAAAAATSCPTIDGYYVQSVICVTLGFLWLKLNRKRVQRLQNADLESWKISEWSEVFDGTRCYDIYLLVVYICHYEKKVRSGRRWIQWRSRFGHACSAYIVITIERSFTRQRCLMTEVDCD